MDLIGKWRVHEALHIGRVKSQNTDVEKMHFMLFNLLKTNTFFLTSTALVIINIFFSLFVYE